MELIKNHLYNQDVKTIAELNYSWEQLKDKNILITGATGMIGSFLIDVIMHKNMSNDLNCHIFAIGRNTEKAINRFKSYFDTKHFSFHKMDINQAVDGTPFDRVDYIIHAASNTHPRAYSGDPIGTITTNVFATKYLLDLAYEKQCKNFIFLSSVEVYGENKGDVEKFKEDYCGYIDCNTLRAGYPESKRVGESLCQAYIAQKQLNVLIPRLSRVYGPSMLLNDSKALSQFILKAVNNEDIVLKSKGNQYYSYTYVADVVSGILKIMFDGKSGEAYNVCNPESDITLKELAESIAAHVNRNVLFELPDEAERKGYSTATKAILDPEKIEKLGWKPKFNFSCGISHTIDVLKSISK